MYSGPLSPLLSRACLFSLCLIVSSVVSCHTETKHLPRAKLRVKVHLGPVDQAWLTAYEPSLMLSAAGGPPVKIELSERHLEASRDIAELVFAGTWRGDVTFTLSHLTSRGGRRRVSHQVTLEGSTRRSYQSEALLADTHNAQSYDHEVWLEPVNFVGISDISWTRSLNISDHEWWSTPSQRVDQEQVHSALRGAWSHLVHAEIRRGQERGSHEEEASSIEDSWSMLVAINSHLSEMSPEEADPMLAEWGRALQGHACDHLDGSRLTTAAYHLLRALPCSLISLAEKGRESESEVGEECRRERDREVYISVSEGSPRRGAGGELIEDLIIETISLSDRVTSSLKVTWIDALGDEHNLYDRERLEVDTASSDSIEHPQPDAYSTISYRGEIFITPERRERVSIMWRDVNRPRVRLKVIAIDEARKRSTLEVSRALHDTPQVSLRGLASIADLVDVGAVRAAPLEEVIVSEVLHASAPPFGAGHEVRLSASPTLFAPRETLPATLWEGQVAEGRYQLDHSGYLGPLWVEVSAERDNGAVTLALIADPSQALSPRVLQDLEQPEHKLTINAWSSPMSQLGVWLAMIAILSETDESGAIDDRVPQADDRDDLRVEAEEVRRDTRALARLSYQIHRRFSHINGAPTVWFERGELQGDPQGHLWLQAVSARDQVAECIRYGATLLETEPDDVTPLTERAPWSSLMNVELIDDADISWAIDQWALFMMSACHRASVAREEPLKLTSLLTASLSSGLVGDEPDWAHVLMSDHWVTSPQDVWAYDEDRRAWRVSEPEVDLHIHAARGVGVIALSELSALEPTRDQPHRVIRSAELSSTEDPAFSEIFTPPQRFVGRCLWGERSGGSRELNQHEVTWEPGAWGELPLNDLRALRALESAPTVNVESTNQRAWVWGLLEHSEELKRLVLPFPCDATLRLTLDPETFTHDWYISTYLWGQHQPDEPRSSVGSPASAVFHALADLTERVNQRVRVELDQAPPHLLFSEATLGDDTLERPDLNSRLLAEIGVDISLDSAVGVITQDHLSDADDQADEADHQEAHAYPHYFLKRVTPRDGPVRISWVTNEPSRCYAVTQLEDLDQHNFALSSAGLIESLPTLEVLSRGAWHELYQRDLGEATPLGDSTDLSVFTRVPSTRASSEGIHRAQIRGYTSWNIDAALPALLDGTYSLYAGCIDTLGHETITPLAVTVDGEAPQVHSLTLSGIDERVLSHDGVRALPSAAAEDLTRTVNLLSDADATIVGEPLVAGWHRTSAHWRSCLGTCALRPLLLSVEASDSQWSHRALTVTLTGRLSVARGTGEPRGVTEISPLRVSLDEAGRAQMNIYGLIQRTLIDERASLIPTLGETLTFRGLVTLRDPLNNQKSFVLKLDLHSIPPAVEVAYTPPLEEIGTGINAGRWGALYQGDLGTLTVRNPHDENLSVRLIPPLLQWGTRYGVRDFGVAGGEVYYQRVADTCLMTASGLAPRLGFALTEFSSSLDPHDGVCVQLPSLPTLVDDHVTLELHSEDQLIPAQAFRELQQPYLLDAAPDALIGHVAPPDEEVTPQLPSTARVEILEQPGYYMSPFYSSCDGPCTPQTLILGQRITSLMWLSLTESVDEEEINPILAQYPLATAERFEQYVWYISVTSPDPEIRSTLTPLLIPLSYPTLESEYHAEAPP